MNKKILTTFLFAATFFLLTGKPAQAQETNTNALQPYEEKLEELSSELGTELAIVPSENGTMEETIDFYTNMSIEDFESYVKDAYEEGELLDEITDAHLSEDFSSLEVAPLASIAYYQKYYYSAGVVSLKRLLNQSNLKSWSSKMIKKSLEAYFFTLKTKIVFCKKQFQNMSVFCFASTEIV